MIKKIIFLLTFLFISQAHAQEICPIAKGVDLTKFREIPVLDAGRVKPIDSYARNLLLTFSGKTTYDNEDAIYWLATLLFDSQKTREDQVFLINNPLIAETLKIEPEEKRRYSFSQLQPGFPKLQELAQAAQRIESVDRDIVESEILRLYENISLYSRLSLMFAFALPHPDFEIKDPEAKKEFDLDPETTIFSYLDIALRAQMIQQRLMMLQSRPEEEWTSTAKEVFQATSHLMEWSGLYHNLPLAFVPSYRFQDDVWYAPWDAMPDALTLEEGREELFLLRNLLFHYWNGNQVEFDLSIKQLLQSFKERPGIDYDQYRNGIQLELFYNKINPFFWAKFLYVFSFVLVFLSYLIPRIPIRRLSGLLIGVGFCIHFVGLLLRIVILQRPPVSNLYETFIFVGFVSVISGIIIERIHKGGLGQLVSSISGLVFLFIANRFALEGDTLQMLVAVLNSNFWLSTHVISITIGYSGACVAGVIGHMYVLQAIFKPQDKKALMRTHKILLGALGFGLTMTFLGTNLGGIWADQSWGRFWGWDPKENGALMIVLWSALLFHAKIGKVIGPLGMAIGCILGNIVVMWAWFGVNLLSVGLHSYGFTSGLATNLAIYFCVQLGFIFIMYPLARRRQDG